MWIGLNDTQSIGRRCVVKNFGVLLLLAYYLAGCSLFNQPEHLAFEHLTAVEGEASTSLLIAGAKDAKFNICAQPAPDAARSETMSEDLNISLISMGAQSQESRGGASVDEQEMIGRTPSVLLSREMFYRLCEFMHNVDLSNSEKIELYKATLDAVTRISISEHKNTSIKIGESLDTIINNNYKNITGLSGDSRRRRDTSSASGTSSPTGSGQCSNQIDDDGDGSIDQNDPNCLDPLSGIYSPEGDES
jgi:hypothetical protein